MATGALSPTPLQWFDNAGAVLAGGSITTYLTGTTTPTSTWSAIAMGAGNLNANPVVLDSAGRATIYVLRGLGYRFVPPLSSSLAAATPTQPDRSRAAGTGGRTLPPRKAKK